MTDKTFDIEIRCPTISPSSNPSISPTNNPSVSPTKNPSASPTKNPSTSPTKNPSASPTKNPSTSPTKNPSAYPTKNPSASPKNPSASPTKNPSAYPTKNPSDYPTKNPSDSPTKNPTDNPTQNPSLSPTLNPSSNPTNEATPVTQMPSTNINPKFPGYMQFVKGMNIFFNQLSDKNVLDVSYIKENTASWAVQNTTCPMSLLEFDSMFESYVKYASSDLTSISDAYSSTDSAAAGCLSSIRTTTKTYAISEQSYIYKMHLECSTTISSIVAYNNVHWDEQFVNGLKSLPTSFNSAIDDYIDFWNSFGTHLITIGKLGGSIHGVITADKCNIEKTFNGSDTYQARLNAEYNGIGSEGSDVITSSVGDVITNKQFIVRGGDIATDFVSIFNSFGNKSDGFQTWSDSLYLYPDMIGGNIHTIHNVIKETINLGNHKLNDVLSVAIEDDTWLNIANALQSAYTLYSQQLMSNDTTISDGQCALKCNNGILNSRTCQCIDCSSDGKCCGFDADKGNLVTYGHVCIIVHCILFLLL
eukprot:62542_1